MSQTGSMVACPHCPHKQQVIEKYTKLAALLAKKVAHYDNSKSKISGISSSLAILPSPTLPNANTFLTTLARLVARRETQAYLKIKQLSSRHGHGWSVAVGLPTPTPLKDLLIQQCQVGEGRYEKLMVKTDSSKTQQKGMIAPNRPQCTPSAASQKEQARKLFHANLENQRLHSKIRSLKVQVQDGLRRQQKEIAKKRQSLQGLAEELSEKNELIEELKMTVKVLQGKLGAKQRGILHAMLQQDSESLSKVVFRLENINDKLNIDLDKARKEKSALEGQLKEAAKQNEDLQVALKKLREENFDFEQNRLAVATFKKELEIMSQKLNGKMQKLRTFQRKLGDLSKARDGLSCNILQNMLQLKSDRRMAVTQAETVTLQRTASLRDLQLQNKLQSIFTYLFHIDDHSHNIQYPELFDEEERQLLNTHKEKYMAKLKITQENSMEIHRPIKRKFSEHCLFGDSVLDVLQEQEMPIVPPTVVPKLDNTMTDLERQKMVEKIGELKERQMHIRSVIHSFLKSVDLKSLKKESEAILTILCDLFEYSEGERALLFQPKGKKLFGFI